VVEVPSQMRAVVRRGFQKSAATLRTGDLELDRHRRRAQRSGRPIPLTSKEFALLELLLLRSPDIVPRSEILEHIWDAHFDSGTNLVEVYIKRLRQKIDHGQAAKLIHTVRGVGYRLGAEE
jgi:DNA-binding response OmpR family regulator